MKGVPAVPNTEVLTKTTLRAASRNLLLLTHVSIIAIGDIMNLVRELKKKKDEDLKHY